MSNSSDSDQTVQAVRLPLVSETVKTEAKSEYTTVRTMSQADEIVLGNTASPGTIPKRLEHLRGALEVVFITKRPRPSRPRSVKISKTRYPVKHSAAPLK